MSLLINKKASTFFCMMFFVSGLAQAMCEPVAPAIPDLGGGAGGNPNPLPDPDPDLGGGVAPCAFVGNPVNMITGVKVQREVDYVPGGASTLTLERFYNSTDGLWRHNYSDSLLLGRYYITFTDWTGYQVSFEPSSLKRVSGGKGVLTKSGNLWVFQGVDGVKKSFDGSGRLTSSVTMNGRVQTLSYGADNKITVSDDSGAQLILVNSIAGQVSGASINGFSAVYEYDAGMQLIGVKKTSKGVTVSRKYLYEDPRHHLLTGIIDETGKKFASWRYDAEYGRAIYSEHADGAERIAIEYRVRVFETHYTSPWGGYYETREDPDITTVINSYGKKTEYHFTRIGGVNVISKIVGQPSPNCPASDSSYSYDSLARVVSKTDAKGMVTTFKYNDRDLIVEKVEAVGTPVERKIITEWHPTLSVPLKVTKPDRVVQYTYTPRGYMLSKKVMPL